MKSEILDKLKSLLETENILSVQREFKQLSAQFRSLMAHGLTEIDDSEEDEEEHEDDLHEEAVNPDNQIKSVMPSAADVETQEAATVPPTDTAASIQENEETTADSTNETQEAATDTDLATEPPTDTAASTQESEEATADSTSETQEAATDTDLATEPPTDTAASIQESEETTAVAIDESNASTEEIATTEAIETSNQKTEEKPSEKEEETSEGVPSMEEAIAEFKKLWSLFKEKTEKQRELKKQIEKETILTAKDLLKELETLVENEENIAKAFNGFNAIQEKWRNLPKVSNDAYRDLNAEYNRFAEQFFYNINIYKELKELDLKRNLEEKLLVIADQKKLLEVNDIRVMEVDVRLNQDRWNEIGPTYKEDWDKIKDEFWMITRGIYKKIQDFYTQRREQQEKNLVAKTELLNKLKQIASLDLRSHKKWQEKTKEVIALQKEWKMIGYVPKEKTEVWKEFRKLSDLFFDNKREYYQAVRKEQNANRDLKMALVKRAEELKDSDDWNATSAALIELQKQWKTIGSAHQRDENRMWRKFRQACDHFFQRRKDRRTEENLEFENNLKLKNSLIEEMRVFEPGNNVKENIETLKQFSAKWHEIGHVPYKNKDKVNKEYKKVLDQKFSLLKIDQKEKEKIQFEQKLENLKELDNKDYIIRKERDSIRNKISKLEQEVMQLETNIGFFADSKGANKLKSDVENKIENAKAEIDILYERLKMLKSSK